MGLFYAEPLASKRPKAFRDFLEGNVGRQDRLQGDPKPTSTFLNAFNMPGA